jgi:hypothetical protein
MNESGSGWHIGMSSAVRLAALIPAKRAISNGFPFGLRGSSRNTLAPNSTKAEASASRGVAGLAETSTMVALPAES